MENALQAVINFDENITREQLKTYYFYSWKKKLPKMLKSFLLIIFLLFILDTFVRPERNRADFIQFLLFFIPISCIFYAGSYFFNKANYISKINIHLEDMKKCNNITELYFEENSFMIKSEQFDIRSIWKNVSYDVVDETIYIKIMIGESFTYILERKETNQYEDILNFLQRKCKSS